MSHCGPARRDNTTKPTLIRRCYITEVPADWTAISAHGNIKKSPNVVAVAGLIVPLRFPQKCRLAMRPIRRAIHAVDRKRRDTRFALPRTVLFGLIGLATIVVGGCATIAPRNVLPQANAGQIELQGFHNIRFWGDAPVRDIQAIMMADAPKTETRGSAGTEKHKPFANLLAISGGAEDGAFGAGLLVGWSDAGTRPVFDLVTGVSSGALIAPFAFLGREHDNQLREIFTKYGRKDIFTYNVSGLLEGAALADDAPLAQLIAKYIDEDFIQEIARERIKGRILLIGTTNLDTQRPVLWDMGRIAMRLACFARYCWHRRHFPGCFRRSGFRCGSADRSMTSCMSMEESPDRYSSRRRYFRLFRKLRNLNDPRPSSACT
jgi:hypothetical protein